jgi:hypothetical protein
MSLKQMKITLPSSFIKRTIFVVKTSVHLWQVFILYEHLQLPVYFMTTCLSLFWPCACFIEKNSNIPGWKYDNSVFLINFLSQIFPLMCLSCLFPNRRVRMKICIHYIYLTHNIVSLDVPKTLSKGHWLKQLTLEDMQVSDQDNCRRS